MKFYIKNTLLAILSFTQRVFQKLYSLRLLYKAIIGIILLGGFIAYKTLLGHGYIPQAKVVEIYKVSKGNILKTIRLLGTIESQKLFTATAGYDGTISYVAPAGTSLKAGEIIAKIQNDSMEAAYKAAIETVDNAKTQLKRMQDLYTAKATSKQSVEDQFSVLSTAKAALVNAQVNYDKVVFVAPFDGIVGSSVAQAGMRAQPGDTIVTFYDNSAFVVKFDIPSSQAKTLGQDASVTINANIYKIDFIQKALSSGTYTVPAHVTFPCSNCFSGELMDVDLHIVNKQNIIIVPDSCVFIRNKDHFVFGVKDGIANLKLVKLGILEKDQIEVTDGLVEGDEIVLKGQYRLYPGIEVKIWDGKEVMPEA